MSPLIFIGYPASNGHVSFYLDPRGIYQNIRLLGSVKLRHGRRQPDSSSALIVKDTEGRWWRRSWAWEHVARRAPPSETMYPARLPSVDPIFCRSDPIAGPQVRRM